MKPDNWPDEDDRERLTELLWWLKGRECAFDGSSSSHEPDRAHLLALEAFRDNWSPYPEPTSLKMRNPAAEAELRAVSADLGIPHEPWPPKGTSDATQDPAR